MCDDVTDAENQAWINTALDRRRFAGIATGAAAAAVLPAAVARAQESARPVASRDVVIVMPDGKADAFFVHPAKGRHPAVIMWPDIAGLREAYRTMATRLAEEGFSVLVVNQYYRSSAAPVLQSFAEWRTDAGRAKLQPMIAAITPAATTRDGGAFVAWLDRQAEVDTRRRIGSCGYCMGGPFTVRTAVASPGRVGAAASFHGASLVTDTPDSPAALLEKTKAAYLFAIARNDDERAPGDKDKLRAAAKAAGRPAEVEVYPAQHGWCTIDSPVYDQAQAEKAWGRMLALFRTHL